MAINGQAPESFLKQWKLFSNFEDHDAAFNHLFWSPASNALELNNGGPVQGMFGGSGPARLLYPGPTTTLKFRNGTEKTFENFAKVNVDFTGVDDGESFYRTFCTGSPKESPTLTSSTSLASNASLPSATPSSANIRDPVVLTPNTPAYPQPLIRHPSNLNAGYYLNFSSYSSVAVLSVINFVDGYDTQVESDFQATNRNFLHLAKSAGKTKLIIDLSGNNGGTVFHAFDLFKQLFPHLEPYGASRFRAFPEIDAIGQHIADMSDVFSNGTNTTEKYLEAAKDASFNYRLELDANMHNFPSWSSLYGPHVIPGRDSFSNLLRWNFSSPLLTVDGGFNVTGYQSLVNETTNNVHAPFKSEDIIMLHDGFCASTCSIFADLMRTQGGVKSVVMGGGPHKGPMQAVGGTRGAVNTLFAEIYSIMNETYQAASPAQQAAWNISAPDLGQVNDLPIQRTGKPTWGSVNARDIILDDVDLNDGFPAPCAEKEVPSQFLHVPADCRLFYTPQMIGDVQEVWKAVAEATWGDKGVGKQHMGGKVSKKKCVAGGL
jgi:Peptidase family S41